MKRCLVLICIDRISFNYEFILRYLSSSSLINQLSLVSNGFLVYLTYEQDRERRQFISDLLMMDTNNIEIYPILWDEIETT